MARTVLVIGANKGIGLNLCKIFAEKGWSVTGTVRPQTKTEASIAELKKITSKILSLDYTDESSIVAVAAQIGDIPLNVLVNCAGVEPQPVTWQEHSGEKILEKFQIMAVGPFLATKHLLPALERGKGTVVNISSNMASINDNKSGTNIAYRVAKAALNQITVTIAMELASQNSAVTVNSIHPGWTPTDVSHWTGPDDMQEVVTTVVDTIEKLDGTSNGRFMDRSGKDLAF